MTPEKRKKPRRTEITKEDNPWESKTLHNGTYKARMTIVL